ncbi:hypothetical protein FKP32DRAFT_1597570 [Trametes sanguinea]|nr:hypothetical protein FKP32DRAFT_1597570 [Trametes sanguinea]
MNETGTWCPQGYGLPTGPGPRPADAVQPGPYEHQQGFGYEPPPGHDTGNGQPLQATDAALSGALLQ